MASNGVKYDIHAPERLAHRTCAYVGDLDRDRCRHDGHGLAV